MEKTILIKKDSDYEDLIHSQKEKVTNIIDTLVTNNFNVTCNKEILDKIEYSIRTGQKDNFPIFKDNDFEMEVECNSKSLQESWHDGMFQISTENLPKMRLYTAKKAKIDKPYLWKMHTLNMIADQANNGINKFNRL